jgi:hypothetical protein
MFPSAFSEAQPRDFRTSCDIRIAGEKDGSLRNAFTGAIHPLVLQISDPPKKTRYSRQSRFFRWSFPSQPIPQDSLWDPEFSGRFSIALLGVFGVTAQGVQNLVGSHTEASFNTEKPNMSTILIGIFRSLRCAGRAIEKDNCPLLEIAATPSEKTL